MEVPLHHPPLSSSFFFFITFSEWVNELDPLKACELFREELLRHNAECPHLFLAVDTFDAEEQDSALISFYKQHDVNWAAPLKCRLRGITNKCTIL